MPERSRVGGRPRHESSPDGQTAGKLHLELVQEVSLLSSCLPETFPRERDVGLWRGVAHPVVGRAIGRYRSYPNKSC